MWKTFIDSLPRITAHTAKKRMADVTVLTPPAVLAGEPPIYISTMEITFEAYVILPCPIESKPAVLNVTDWNKLAIILWKNEKFPIVYGLKYSAMKKNNPPNIIRTAVVISAILV